MTSRAMHYLAASSHALPAGSDLHRSDLHRSDPYRSERLATPSRPTAADAVARLFPRFGGRGAA